MAFIEETLFTELTAYGPLNAIINNRLFPQPPTGLPQGQQPPAITYQRISAVRLYDYKGRAGQITSRFQFNVFGRTVKESRAATAALISAFDPTANSAITFRSVLYGPIDRDDPYTKSIFPSLDAVISHHEAPPP